MALRWYQEEAVNAVMAWVRKTSDPCLIEAPTGAGKSMVCAEIADRLHRVSGGKHVLCLAPKGELVEQNSEKFRANGLAASLYSASVGVKCLRHPVVFATPGTFKAVAGKIGHKFCAVVLDEAHGITPTIIGIIEAMRAVSPNLRVIGMTATPYRLGAGYIYKMDEQDKLMREARDPFFTKLVYKIKAKALVEEGYLVPPVIGETGGEAYDTGRLVLNKRGQFDAADIDRAFVGHGRKTAAVVGDVVDRTQGAPGVMIFAATVAHAQEVMASLPPALSKIVTGDTPKAERKEILAKFKAKKIKYLVNVAVLTTGFDCPHVSHIALLRLTESTGLLQQIIGRGLRPCPGKKEAVILDYAGNLERHFPDGDLFAPEIRAGYKSGGEAILTAECPGCGYKNEFKPRPDDSGANSDQFGYFVDLAGNRVKTEWGFMPSHYGRRCEGLALERGKYERCNYRWTCKKCPECDAENDIAARRCCECKAEIIDPNERLQIQFKRMKRDPTVPQTDEVLSLDCRETVTRKGQRAILAGFVTPYRKFDVWFMPDAMSEYQYLKYSMFQGALDNGGIKTVSYKKNADNGFYEILGYNGAPDEIPTMA